MSRTERAAVYVVVFLSGALLMALEIAAFRIIAKTFGSALRETTAVIATFLASMSVGYWLGGKAGDRWPHASTLTAILLSAAAFLFCVPWVDSAVSPLVAESHLDLALHAFVATSVLFSIPTVLLASVSPIAVRLFASTTTRSGSTAGGISALSTIGSIAGSVFTAFVLIDRLGSIARTVLAVGTTTCVAALLLLLASTTAAHATGRRRLAALVLAPVLILGTPLVAYTFYTRIERSMLAPIGDWQTIFSGDSPYHRVTVTEHRKRDRILTFALGQQSVMSLADPYGPGANYTDSLHIARFIRPSVRRVLVIGLGGGTAAKQFTNYYADTTVDVVEIDPMVIDVAQRFFFVRPSARLRLHNADGRTFLRRTKETWDLIIIDAYTTNRYGDTLPPHLATKEFFEEARAHLSPGGIFHFHCAFGGKLPLALQKTAANAFAYAYVTGGETLASDAAILTDSEKAIARMRATPAARLPHLAEAIRQLKPYAAVPADIPLLTDDYAPVDTLR